MLQAVTLRTSISQFVNSTGTEKLFQFYNSDTLNPDVVKIVESYSGRRFMI